MIFEILWTENKTSSKGTNYKKVSMQDESGRKLENVAVFSFFTDYDKVMPGSKVEGVLEEKAYNGKISYSLGNMVSTSFTRSQGAPGGFKAKPSGAVEAAKLTEKSVEKAQDRNELGFQAGGTFRDATLITTMQLAGSNPTDQQVKEVWSKWRSWLWNEYWKEDKDFEPF